MKDYELFYGSWRSYLEEKKKKKKKETSGRNM